MKIKNGRWLGLLAVPLALSAGAFGTINHFSSDGVGAGATTADDLELAYINPQGYTRVTNVTQYPYGATVRVSMEVNGVHDNHCSGQIVAPNIVITAAHCFLSVKNGALVKERNGARVQYMTSNTGLATPSTSSETLRASKILFYDRERYINSKSAVNGYDLAFLLFDEPFQVRQFTAKPTPIVDTAKDNYIGDTLSYSGFPADNPETIIDADKKEVGYPTGVTAGYMYRTSGPVNTKTSDSPYLYHYDLSVVGGSSGSGVVNAQNKVVGVNIARSKIQDNGYGLMLPLEGDRMTFAKKVIADNALTGWYTQGGKRYYFESDGALATGEKTMGDKKYTFSTTTGELLSEATIQRGSVYVKHVDQDGKEIAPQETLVNNQVYGTSYIVQVKTLEKYEAGKVISGSSSGTVNSANTTIVVQYQIKRGSIYVKYVDKNGKDIIPQETLANNQPYDTRYTVTPKNIQNYNAGKLKSGTASGVINKASDTIVFESELKRGSVYIRGVDEDGQEIYKETVVDNAEYGTKFTPAPKNLEAFHLDGEVEVSEVTLSDSNAGSTIEYKYVSKKGTIIYRAVDKNGNEIAIKTIAEDVKYGTEFTVEMEQINGYTLAADQVAQKIIVKEGDNIVEMTYDKIPEEKLPQSVFGGPEVGTFSSDNNAESVSKLGVNAPNTGFERPHETAKIDLGQVIVFLASATLGMTILMSTKFKKIKFV